MKLGISYNLFDGEELLESSILSVRKEAYHINVIYQTTSYYGNKANDNLESHLKHLKEKGLIDEIYHYNKVFDQNDKHIYEIEKRNIGLDISRKAGCTHFLSMDVDEFYDSEQLKNAKYYILRNKICTSAVSIIEYLKEPTYKFVNSYTFTFTHGDIYNFYVPFIMKIHHFKKQKHNRKWYPCLVDPSRALNNKEKFYLFPKQNIVMHHMSTIRKNLSDKYNNSNFNNGTDEAVTSMIKEVQKDIIEWDFEKYQISEKYSLFQNKLIEKTKNIFNINI